MSCIAMSVGLGNVWRFPFTAFENGGGAFLIPYLFTLLVIARPLYYMEMILGQFTSRSNVHMFRSLAPALHGKLKSLPCHCRPFQKSYVSADLQFDCFRKNTPLKVNKVNMLLSLQPALDTTKNIS